MDPTTFSHRTVCIEKNKEMYTVSIKKGRAKYVEKYGARLNVYICVSGFLRFCLRSLLCQCCVRACQQSQILVQKLGFF
jgi:hypothetical protein